MRTDRHRESRGGYLDHSPARSLSNIFIRQMHIFQRRSIFFKRAGAKSSDGFYFFSNWTERAAPHWHIKGNLAIAAPAAFESNNYT